MPTWGADDDPGGVTFLIALVAALALPPPSSGHHWLCTSRSERQTLVSEAALADWFAGKLSGARLALERAHRGRPSAVVAFAARGLRAAERLLVTSGRNLRRWASPASHRPRCHRKARGP
jgi:hypothetical protein